MHRLMELCYKFNSVYYYSWVIRQWSSPNNITAAAFMLVCWSAARKRPWLTQNLTNQAVNSSSTLKLECDALGVPRPEITWYKNEVLLKQSPGNLNVSFQKDICHPFSIILTPGPCGAKVTL